MEDANQILKQTSLPLYLTGFVGRKREEEDLITIIQEKPLVTLVGAGGMGKTRLALHTASEMTATFTDGIFLIELASLIEPAMLLQSVASTLISSALHTQADQDASLLSLLSSALHNRHCLLILDNCEHMREACASLITSLLQSCPQLHILATSREPLQVEVETIGRIGALSYPQPEQALTLDHIAQYEAIQLFCQRAIELDPRFQLTKQNAPAIVRICHQLDGIPLALELATARLSVLSVDQLATRLHASFALLNYGPRTAISHHQTLQATFDWSYALLSLPEQALFQRLAVFAGSWNKEAIEYIMEPTITEPYFIIDVLTYLVNKSLVIAEEQERQDGQTEEVEIRYNLLRTVQQYALEKAQQAVDWPELRERNDAWYLHIAEEAKGQLRGAEQIVWLHRLDVEMPNIRAVLTRSLALGRVEMVIRIAEALSRFWIIRNQFSEGRYWFETLLATAELSPLLRARVLFGAAEFARYQGVHARTCTLLAEEVALLETLDEPSLLAEAQVYLGAALAMNGEHERAQQLCQTGLQFYRERHQVEGITRTLLALSLSALSQGKYLQAITLSEEGCSLLREAGDYSYLLYALFTLAQATILQGNLEQARNACREAFHLSQQLKQNFGLAASLGLIASVARLQGQMTRAAYLFGAAQGLQQRLQAPLPPSGQALQERMIFLVRDALGKEQFDLHYSEGQNTPLAQILEEAETILQDASTLPATNTQSDPSADSPLASLSQREREILALIARGISYSQIAERLLISRYTVSSHLQSIYSKLHINSRSAATRLALENGLI